VHVLRGLDVHDRQRLVVGRLVERIQQRVVVGLVERIQQRVVVGQFWRGLGLVRRLYDGQLWLRVVRLSHPQLLRVGARRLEWDRGLRPEAGRRSERLHEQR
jgi:hypothetical protein